MSASAPVLSSAEGMYGDTPNAGTRNAHLGLVLFIITVILNGLARLLILATTKGGSIQS